VAPLLGQLEWSVEPNRWFMSIVRFRVQSLTVLLASSFMVEPSQRSCSGPVLVARMTVRRAGAHPPGAETASLADQPAHRSGRRFSPEL
jgi:hypothetical protein